MKKRIMSVMLCFALLIGTFSNFIVSRAEGGTAVTIMSPINSTDENLRFSINADDGMPVNNSPTYYTWQTGGIYVNGKLMNIAMIKSNQKEYMIYFTWGKEFVPVEGTTVKIDGTMTDGTNTVSFEPAYFWFDGTGNWTLYHQEITMTAVSNQGTNLVLQSDVTTQLTDGWHASMIKEGYNFFKEDGTKYYVPMQKSGSNYYFWDNGMEFPLEDGLVVTLDAIYGDANYAIRFNRATFIYDSTRGGWCNVDNYYEDVAIYRANGTYPTKEGKIFAGWYQDMALTDPLLETESANAAYAKFVDEKVLSVKFQLAAGTTMASSETALRMLTSIDDSFNYQLIQFDVTVGGQTKNYTTKTVYAEINVYVDETTKTPYKADEVFENSDSTYFVAYKLNKIPNSAFGTTIHVTPKWKTLDGTTVTGQTRAIIIGDNLPKLTTITTVLNEGDKNLRFFISEDDGIPATGQPTYYTWQTGGIYVNGIPMNIAMLKAKADLYMMYFDFGKEFIPVKGTTVKIDGTMTNGSNTVTFAPAYFWFDGEGNWTRYHQEVTMNILPDQGRNIVLQPETTTQLADGWYGSSVDESYNFYKEDGTKYYVPVQKSGNYYYFWDSGMSFTLEDGLTLTLDAIYGDANYAVRCVGVYRYNGITGNWECPTN